MINKKCALLLNGRCNSDYFKNKKCDLKKCPYRNGGSYPMAVSDKKNEVEIPDYNSEFSLNMEHQVIGKIKQPMMIGYAPAPNVILFGIMIPKKSLPFKLK